MKVFGLVLLFILILLPIIISGCIFNVINRASEKYERTVELSSDIAPDSKLTAETSNGSIIVTGTEDNMCRIVATITARSFSTEEAQILAEKTQIRIDRTADGLQTVIDRPEKNKSESVDVSYQIQVPLQTRLFLRTSNGKIIVERIENTIDAGTSNGKIEIAFAAGTIIGHTSNGTIVIRDASSPSLDLHTSNGAIQCEGISGNLSASTSNGAVNARYVPDAKVENIRITTSNGAINLATPEDYSAQIDAATSNGKITATIPIEGQQNSKSIKGMIRQGNGQLYLRTSNSSITIN